MSKVRSLSIAICCLSLALVTACGASPPGQDRYVKIPQIEIKEIPINELESVKSKYNINIPFGDSAPAVSSMLLSSNLTFNTCRGM